MTPKDYKNIVVLTGAGISAGSRLGTYRGEDGLRIKKNRLLEPRPPLSHCFCKLGENVGSSDTSR